MIFCYGAKNQSDFVVLIFIVLSKTNILKFRFPEIG